MINILTKEWDLQISITGKYNYISFIAIKNPIKNLLYLNCQYLSQNTRTNFARLQKKKVLTHGVLLYF